AAPLRRELRHPRPRLRARGRHPGHRARDRRRVLARPPDGGPPDRRAPDARVARPAGRRRPRPGRAEARRRMSRVLVVVPPLTGHVNPTVPLGMELADRGHEVTWAGLPGVVDALLPAGARFAPLVGGLDAATFERMQAEARG